MFIIHLALQISFALFASEIFEVSSKEGEKLACDLQVSLTSFGEGIPHKFVIKLKDVLRQSQDLKKVYTWISGLEGETDFCLILKQGSTGTHILEQLTQLLPDKSHQFSTVLKQKQKTLKQTVWSEKGQSP